MDIADVIIWKLVYTIYECHKKYQSSSDHKGTYAMVNLNDNFYRCVPRRNKLEREL